jgi:uncharacterized membrane protein YeaQ/YmgE (transglycosylase-associated protein family)
MENEAHGLSSMPGVGFFGMLIIGILAGCIADKVTASDQGLLTNLLVGITGSFVGGSLLGAQYDGWPGISSSLRSAPFSSWQRFRERPKQPFIGPTAW